MKHTFVKVVSFKQVADYTLEVRFDDSTSQTIDFWPVLLGELYEPLRDKSLFEQVRIDSEVGTLIWPSGADFDPDMLHNWDKLRKEFEMQVAAELADQR
ncbi:MAG: DUF2442 domain-containing protein [Verrucomicrobia bacterium]|nr:DUF2442 domain-containing protein [Verrucomicrobiota bacterium]